MRKTKKFDAFGITYETSQFSAIEAFDMVDYLSIITPLEMLKYTCVIKYDGTKIPLDSDESINEHVVDTVNRCPANIVLRGLINVVSEFNFGFLSEWKGITIPSRFITESKTVQSTYIEPIVANIVTNGLATIKELEEYYSLYDAFAMFDAMSVKSVNEAYAHEAAAAEAKSKRN